jgi:hypothetical protein
MRYKSKWTNKTILCIGLLAGGTLVFATAARSIQEAATAEKGTVAKTQTQTQTQTSYPTRTPEVHHAYVTGELTSTQKRYYGLIWGVEILGVKLVSSGLMLRFSYRVLDVNKAKVLNDKKATPLLIDQKSGAKLEVPTLEKVGQLRQSPPPENGHEYWMVFSNKGEVVKPGSRVDVVIGNFRAKGLIVR